VGTDEPNGVLEETAFYAVLMKLFGRVGPEAAQQFVRAGADLWARFGYTTAQEGRAIPVTARLMRQVAEHQQAHGRTPSAGAVYSERFSCRAVGARYRERLQELWADRHRIGAELRWRNDRSPLSM
jgi:hypothetical protein